MTKINKTNNQSKVFIPSSFLPAQGDIDIIWDSNFFFTCPRGTTVMIWDSKGNSYRGKLMNDSGSSFSIKACNKPSQTFQKSDCLFFSEDYFRELVDYEKSRPGYMRGFHFSSPVFSVCILPIIEEAAKNKTPALRKIQKNTNITIPNLAAISMENACFQ